jgi:hemerythrin superfamily protein
MSDAITLLKSDHATVEALFKQFESAGEKAHKAKRKLVDRMIKELSVHAAIEEMVFYPATKESLEEHHVVKWMLSELEGMDPEHERFVAKVTVLIENVRHHVKEEEKDYFPKVRKLSDRSTLADIGDVLEKAKKVAPTHPHPRSPDEPPANLASLATGLVDRIRDFVAAR